MKMTDNPDAPPVRLAMVLLAEATKADVNELRLAFGEEKMQITQDGEAQSAPGRELYQPTAEAILAFAGVHVWPWTKGVSGKHFDFELSEQRSRWDLQTSDIKRELVLKRIRTENHPVHGTS